MKIEEIANEIIGAFRSKNKLLICGNGGSAAEAQHMAAELVGRYRRERKALPAISLATDTSILTAIANDYGYDKVFSRQVEALGKRGDILLVISTSGKSPNCLEAIKTAESKGLKVFELPKDNESTSFCQEMHLVDIHEICERVERAFI